MRPYLTVTFLLIISFSCSTTSRLDEILKVDRNSQVEVLNFQVKDEKIIEPGRLLYTNSFDKDNQLVETIKYLDNGEIQWDYYHIYTYRDNHLFEEYYFTEDNLGRKLIDGKEVNSYSSNGKLKQSVIFDAENPKDDTLNIKWIEDFIIKYIYNSYDSLIMKKGCSRGSDKCGITSYQYDTLNSTITEVFINQEDTTLNTKDFYQYNMHKDLVYKVHRYRSSYDSTTYKYEDKKIKEEAVFFQSGEQFVRTTFEYGLNGKLVETRHYDMRNKLESVQRYKYITVR